MTTISSTSFRTDDKIADVLSIEIEPLDKETAVQRARVTIGTHTFFMSYAQFDVLMRTIAMKWQENEKIIAEMQIKRGVNALDLNVGSGFKLEDSVK